MQISDRNRFYWEVEGEPTLLLGGSDDDNLFQWPEDRLEEHLNELVKAGGNYVRNTMSDRPENGFEVYPVKEIEDGKYNLDKWNPEYWSRFQNFLQLTSERDIVVQIEIWDCWDTVDSPWGDENYWDFHPYNPKNNVTYSAKESGLPEEWHHHQMSRDHPFYLAPPNLNDIPIVFEYQKAFLEKILSYTFEHDHVLYTVCNETRLPERFSTFWADFLHNKAREEGEEIYVSDMRSEESSEPVLNHPELFNYAELSQVGELHGEAHYESLQGERERVIDSPVPLNVVKQYGSDEGNGMFGDEEEVLRKFWRCLFAGCASFRFHRPTFGIGLNENSKRMIQSARLLQEEADIFDYEPATERLEDRKVDEAYAMQDDDRFLVYFPDGGAVSVDGFRGGEVRWLDVDAAEWGGKEELEDEMLHTPGQNQWIAFVR